MPESQPEVPAAVNTFRQFGSWLDDASAPARGEGYTGIAIGHWRMAEMSQTNVPMLSAGLAVSDRVQVSASVPFYRTSFQGATFHGLDDVYLGARVNLVDPTLTLSEFGLSIGSVVEVLSPGIEGGRVHFAFPVSMELRRAPFRAYGSAGYFTRGSLFSGGAVEWTAPSRFVLTGALTQSYSTGIDETLDLLAVGRQRLDVMASAAYPVGTRGAAYVNLGRSLSSVLEGGTRIAISGGFSFRFSAIPSRP